MDKKPHNLAIKARLKGLGMTQKEFSEMVGISPAALRQALSRPLPDWRERQWNVLLDELEAKAAQKEGGHKH